MSDVSTYTLASKLSVLETRVENIEKQRLEELKEQSERYRRRTEFLMRWTLFGLVLVAAVLWTVRLTLDSVGK